MKLIITGVAGFIGSTLAHRLLKQGHTVIGIDNFDEFYPKALKLENIQELLKNPNFTFLEIDITSPQLVEHLYPYHFEAIIHLAAKAGVRNSLQKPNEYNLINVYGTSNLLELGRVNGTKNFVIASSSSVYGSNTNFPWKESDSQLLPRSPYASSKLASEEIAQSYAQSYGLNIKALRFFTVYGPKQRPDLAIRKFTEAIWNKLPITIFGDGTTERSYTYIDDVVDGIIAALNADTIGFQAFNIGNKETITLNRLISLLESYLGIKAIKQFAPLPFVDLEKTQADLSKSEILLSYRPKVDFEVGLKRFVDWFINLKERDLANA